MKFDPVLFAKAIADETRQKIMGECCCSWKSVNEIVEKIGLSQPTISHHLAILRDADLVDIREEGAAEGDIHKLFAPTNREHGHAARESGLDGIRFEGVAFLIDLFAQREILRVAVPRGVDVFAARQHKRVARGERPFGIGLDREINDGNRGIAPSDPLGVIGSDF